MNISCPLSSQCLPPSPPSFAFIRAKARRRLQQQGINCRICIFTSVRVALRWSGGAICPPDDLEIVADRGQEDMVMYVIEITELKF